MRITMTEGDRSFCALLGADIRRFLDLLESSGLGIDPKTGATLPNPFEECHLSTTWGLLVAVFHSPYGKVTKAINIDLLTITKDVVISNDGKPVDRYVRIVEELLRLAVAQLHETPSAVPLIRPNKDIFKPYKISTRRSKST